MRRREFLGVLGGVAAWPVVARAQQAERVRRVGVLMAFAQDDIEGQARLAALSEGLGKLGWSEQNLRIDARWGGGSVDQLRKNAGELVSGNPDIIVVSGTPALQAIKRETQTIPVVFANVADPVADRLVPSLAHPGGNITGYTNFEEAITGKWLEILKEVVPTITDVLVLYYPDSPAVLGLLRTIRKVAATFRVQLVLAPVTDGTQIEGAIKTSGQRPNSGMIIFPDANIGVHRFRIISLAERYRLPAIYPLPYFVRNGGLISYGVDPLDLFRRSASYVDRILRGEKPAELPIQGPTKFDLVVNLKTAKAIGLTIPESFLLRADEVIE